MDIEYLYFAISEYADECVFIDHDDALTFCMSNPEYDCVVERPVKSVSRIGFNECIITMVNGDVYMLHC